jgi:multidrug resistance protein, MATE family
MNEKILRIAVPSVISNITVPLLGLVDIAIAGHLGSTAYIGAIAVGSMLFDMIYWAFGFLRMGTSGMTSQPLGRRDFPEISRTLIRSLGVGLFIGLLILVLQRPIEYVAFYFISPSPEVHHWASVYFRICIWGAPAVLCLYGFNGWFIGMQNSRIPMFVAVVQNIANIIFSLCFVYIFGMEVDGVAWGMLIAQYIGIFLSIGCFMWFYLRHLPTVSIKGCFRKDKMRTFFFVNRDIFLRTLCLLGVTLFFTSVGARQGDVMLAVNTLLMQLFTLFSYLLDGFSNAGEALTGKYVGAGNVEMLHRFIRKLFKWGVCIALFFTVVYLFGGHFLLRILTNNTQVIAASEPYFFWTLLIPLASFVAFLWDGIFIGATATRYMLYAVLLASVMFFVIYFCFRGMLGNHALWLAFDSYLFLRGVLQTMFRHSAIKV